MTDIKSPLLAGTKKEGFERLLQECEHQVKKIRDRNDYLQKNAGTDQEKDIAQEIRRFEGQMEVLAESLRPTSRLFVTSSTRSKISTRTLRVDPSCRGCGKM